MMLLSFEATSLECRATICIEKFILEIHNMYTRTGMLTHKCRMCLQHVKIVILGYFVYAYMYMVFHCGHIMTVVVD